MESQAILFVLIACMVLLLLITIYIIKDFKYREKNREQIYRQKSEYSYRENKMAENRILLERIKQLEYEIIELKRNNSRVIKENLSDEILSDEMDMDENEFKNILNYKIFKDKNKDILDLYDKGFPKESIAKNLNRSIREVEMVINLIR
ncbi:hypothetical protein [Alkaliphilus oremlandii]|uniref:Uncharacterized protein n=1 Tax=Alkaliphilus oremlandii (strain OhILAs) TaxID=350688 RepID=A8MHG8_ALKOO|nr:hypothetical protein [Alkaliphilus oremlandii]ABW19055.1 hypothetical protein Clos_1512 [Alkaliphilus oremlandii OhILAs]